MSHMFQQNPNFKPPPIKEVVTITTTSGSKTITTTSTTTSEIQRPSYTYEPALLPKEAPREPALPATAMACHDGLSDERFGPAVFTSNYLGSPVALFDLQGFSFGCAVLNASHPQHAPIHPPRAQNCTLRLKGYPPGAGYSYFEGLHDFSKVKPAVQVDLWFVIDEAASEPFNQTMAYKNAGGSSAGVELFEGYGRVGRWAQRMVQMDRMDSAWWALGAVTMEAGSGTGLPVQLCIDDVRIKTYTVGSWERGVAKLVHGQGP